MEQLVKEKYNHIDQHEQIRASPAGVWKKLFWISSAIIAAGRDTAATPATS
eukprot:CAMPEP_0119107754 /NCGR_PEP_ID=MMETSP1180-20130426/11585_1 /TAXON_ID=3052 ORGANISM="Chlamydomonas cf sp, Strain CCMP681" /NCGR_SAMPLE_ID=MMETSP1180 /ASSEMBLY_ACC=CAM_ASM_000741 /LENGTH=50 /DNA_ID=CAMNT_0007093291 /DNA_START=1005 /DNA_END=1157 /DNA_ORIENTATION=-